MDFYGLQKMTLLDFPGRVACTLFTAGCNFRCPFCHNAPLVTEIDEKPAYPEKEVLAFLEKRKGLLDGVCITGGEPLLTDALFPFLEKVRAMGYLIKVDTNGSYPERLRRIIREGLADYAAMDIKNAKDKYALTAGVKDEFLPRVEESVSLLLEGRIPYEFRTTVTAQHHTLRDIEEIGKWISGADHYYLQAFVDSGDLVGHETYSAPSEEMMKSMREKAALYVKDVGLRGVG